MRRRLIQSGRERFARYGLDKVTIDELVADARISKGSFYKFFESKEHLFVEVKDQVEEEVFVAYKAALDAVGSDPRAVLTEFFRYPQEHLDDEPFLMEVFRPGVMERVLERVGPELAAVGKDVPRAVIRRWVDEWRETGILRDEVGVDELVGLATIFGAALRTRQFFRTDYEATIELAIDCIVRGLLTR